MTDSPAITIAPSVAPDPLRIVYVDREGVTLNTGEVLLARSEKLRNLCEQLAQESAAVVVQTWWTYHKRAMVAELIEVHRLIFPTAATAPRPASDEVF